MICSKFNELTVPEKTTAIGEMIHGFQNDNECFIAIMDIIQDAKERGVFAGVVINPLKTEE